MHHDQTTIPSHFCAGKRPACSADYTHQRRSAFAASEIERLLKVNQDLQRVARAQAGQMTEQGLIVDERRTEQRSSQESTGQVVSRVVEAPPVMLRLENKQLLFSKA